MTETMRRSARLSGKVAVVTGAARGIGRAAAVAMAKEGASIAGFGVPWLQPEDVAPVVVFLASDEARLVSGATYDVTGGDSANYTA